MDMSPIHSFQNLTIDFSQLGAVELHGEPMRSKNCAVRLSFKESSLERSHRIRFKKYAEASKLFEEISQRWMRFEQNKRRNMLIQEAEKELYF